MALSETSSPKIPIKASFRSISLTTHHSGSQTKGLSEFKLTFIKGKTWTRKSSRFHLTDFVCGHLMKLSANYPQQNICLSTRNKQSLAKLHLTYRFPRKTFNVINCCLIKPN